MGGCRHQAFIPDTQFQFHWSSLHSPLEFLVSLRWLAFVLVLVGCADRPLRLPSAAVGSGDLGYLNASDGGISLDLANPSSGPVPNDLAVIDAAIGSDLSRPSSDLMAMDMTLSAQCSSGGGSVIYLAGDAGDWIHPGAEMIQVPSWAPIQSELDTFWYQSPFSADLHGGWTVGFSSLAMGQPLAVGRYDNAMYHGSESPGRPGLTISGDSRGCDSVTGWFEIESIAGGPVNGTFTELTATFEQHCEGLTPALRGCIHFEN